MNKMQAKLFEMFKWLVNYLDNHNLKYYAIGGTFLGAIRHGGFIPWDDDIDIAMPRDDYNLLISSFDNDKYDYLIEAPSRCEKDYVYSFCKFYDKNTTLFEDVKKPVKRGIYIDIFPLDGIGNCLKESYKYYKKIDTQRMLLAMKVCKPRKRRKFLKNVASILGIFLPFSPNSKIKIIDRLCQKYSFETSLYVGNLMSTYRKKEIIEKSTFGNPTIYSFEGLYIFGPEKFDEYLTNLFGDWRKLPDEKNRVSEHEYKNIDFNKGWKK